MQKIFYLSQDFVTDFSMNIDSYRELYKKSNQEELQKLFEENSFDSGLEFDVPELITSGDVNESDMQNAELLYDSLHFLTLEQASDERLWLSLFHTVFIDFLRFRVGDEDLENGKFKHTSVLFTGSNNDKTRAKLVNYLSRLWWTGYYTKKDGNYDLLPIVAESDLSGILISFFSSTFTSNLDLTHGALRAIKDYYQMNNGKIRRRLLFNETSTYLNAVSSSRFLDMLSEDDIYDIVYEYLDKIAL